MVSGGNDGGALFKLAALSAARLLSDRNGPLREEGAVLLLINAGYHYTPRQQCRGFLLEGSDETQTITAIDYRALQPGAAQRGRDRHDFRSVDDARRCRGAWS